MRRLAAAMLLALVLGACRPGLPPPPTLDPVALPDPAEVERVLFLLGDPGEAETGTSPLLHRLQQDIEYWAGRLESDSAVAVLVLGDVVYPTGVHPPDDATFHADTAVVMAQVRLVLGPAAIFRGARMYFLAGNHDWGLRRHREGYARLRNLEDFLAFARATTGAAVELAPAAGSGGPVVVDYGQHLRLLLLDTAWWLVSGSGAEKAAVMERLELAMETAGERQVAIAAHHPFRSVGPHGGFFPFWQAAGMRFILAKSGAVLQDLTSEPYRDFEAGLRAIFGRLGPAFAFVGGHEHSLQVIEAVDPTDPRFSLVSGSGSKLSDVGYEAGVRFAASAPGYMRMVVEKSGGITLFVEAAPREYLKCPGDHAARERCVQAGIAAFGTVYSQRLR
jgi:hypothetical protein